MKHITLEEWERKYIVGPVPRFDQKMDMFKRCRWDPTAGWAPEKDSYLDMATRRYPPEERAGFILQDLALRQAVTWGIRMRSVYFTPRALEAIPELPPGIVDDSLTYRMSSVDSGGENLGAPLNLDKGTKLDASDPQKAARDIKKVATYFGADLVGITELDKQWLYSHTYDAYTKESKPLELPEEYKYIIVMAFAEDHDMLRYPLSHIADATAGMGYSKMAITSTYLARFIKLIGYKAIPCSNDTAPSIPLAMRVGLGELGRNGLLITPEFGPRVRLAKVLTDLPLVADTPIEFGVTEFCSKCEICADSCPSHAIIHGERTAKPNSVSNTVGVLKWPIHAERCLKFWASAKRPCHLCVSTCPFNKQMDWFHRTVLWFVDYVRWADPFYVKMDKLLGYGKPAKAKDFWDEWQPKAG